jgi:hypothetical protein
MTAGASFYGRADDPQPSPFLLGMLVDWTGGFPGIMAKIDFQVDTELFVGKFMSC